MNKTTSMLVCLLLGIAAAPALAVSENDSDIKTSCIYTPLIGLVGCGDTQRMNEMLMQLHDAGQDDAYLRLEKPTEAMLSSSAMSDSAFEIKSLRSPSSDNCSTDAFACFSMANNDNTIRDDDRRSAFLFPILLCIIFCK